MNLTSKKLLITAWNIAVVAFVALAALFIIPKALLQFSSPRATADVIAIGYMAFGVLISVALCASTVLSCFWFQVPIWFRALIGIVVAVLVAGYYWTSNLYDSAPYAFGELAMQAEVITFFSFIAVFTVPLIFLGSGYPGLIRRIMRSRNRTTQ